MGCYQIANVTSTPLILHWLIHTRARKSDNWFMKYPDGFIRSLPLDVYGCFLSLKSFIIVRKIEVSLEGVFKNYVTCVFC